MHKNIFIFLLINLLFFSIGTQANAEEISINTSGETWAIVEQNGNVSNIISCTADVCGDPNSDWSKAVLQDGVTVVKQTDNHIGGYFGQYNPSTETFVIDKKCNDCDTWDNVLIPGTIKNGIVTQPILKAMIDDYEYLSSINTPSIYQAESIVNISFEINRAMSLSTKIKMPKNLKTISKKSKTPKICKINNKQILILKNGKCKIELSKKNRQRQLVLNVSK